MPLFHYDRRVHKDAGTHWVAGIDEAGRGPLAGPVVAAAVILKPESRISGLRDSKKLTAKKRRELFFAVLAESLDVGLGIMPPEEIDRINILAATKRAMAEAVRDLTRTPDLLLIDALNIEEIDLPQRGIIRGDDTSAAIAAASIIAKEIRDGIMRAEDRSYPGYGFARNAGYGTRTHLAALAELGPCPIHRKTFGPVRSLRLF